MLERPDLTYMYDGSFDGLMCCVFESYDRKEVPGAIFGPGEMQMSLFECREVATDTAVARRVADSIPRKICPDALDFIQRAYLTFHPQKERDILLFLRLGYAHGRKVMDMLGNDVVDRLSKAVRHLGQEAHLLSGFLRFSDVNGALVAQITPKNFVLPVLAPHFISRYPGEDMLIYDKNHRTAFLYHGGKAKISPVEDFTLPPPDSEEVMFRKLWKLFYNTIGIKERYNPRCRMTNMPKRYWENMTEFASESFFGDAPKEISSVALPYHTAGRKDGRTALGGGREK